MIDPKPTKRPKLYTCKVCKTRYEKTNPNPMISWCSAECGAKLAMARLDKQKKNAVKAETKAWKDRKQGLAQELGKKGKQTNDPLQMVVNKIAKLLDEDLPCLARPNENVQWFDGGHIYSTGAYPSLRYHLWNIHKQSVKSNRDLGGESTLMLEGIEKRYGKDRREFIESLPSLYPTLQLAAHEKDEALKKARQVLKMLQDGAVLTRDEVNNLIGIYKPSTLQ